MRERPILFSGSMVRAILEGRKTQTRRVYKPRNGFPRPDGEILPDGTGSQWTEWGTSPYGAPGDRLYVREAHAIVPATAYAQSPGVDYRRSPDGYEWAVYREGWTRCRPGRWRPSIHMPRWASRILLEVTEVRVERVQEISEEDAQAEGIPERSPVPGPGAQVGYARAAFRELWDSINADRGHGWDANPWVWVVTFHRIQAPGGDNGSP